MIYLYVGIGGIIGSLMRFFLADLMSDITHYEFPFGTLLANLLGCFILGWLTKAVVLKKLHYNQHLITAVSTGVIGSFTTFSTFSVETVLLIEREQWLSVCIYLFLSIIGGLALAGLGYHLANAKRGQGER